MSLRLLRPENRLTLGELAHPGEEAEADVGVAVLDRRVEAAQIVAVGAGGFRFLQGVQDRLVVLVDQHRDRETVAAVQPLQLMSEPFGARGVVGRHTGLAFDSVQLRHEVRLHVPGRLEVALAEAQAHDRVANRPVPVLVDVQPFEQGFVALEQLLAGVEEQALAEAPGAGEEVVLALVEQAPDVRGLVDVVAVLPADLAEGLNAYGESAPGHGHLPSTQ